MAVEITTFAAEHIDAAAALLTARHERHRAVEPLLADVDARAAIEAVWRRERTSGAVALRDGDVIAYLLGSVRDSEY